MIEVKSHIVVGALALLIAGCVSEEDPITPYDRGVAVETVIEMGGDYRYQAFFDVESNAVVKSNRITEWDLGFRSDRDGHHIILNEAKIMAVADMGPVDFASVTSKEGLTWNYDRPTGEWDATAIGRWWTGEGDATVSRGHVYVIDRGFDPDGKAIGYAKMIVISATPTSYVVRTALLNNSDDRTIEILRDTTRNIVGLSLNENGGIVEVEPPKDEWDLLFTRYTHIFYAPDFTPYSVTGILLNRYRTEAAVDTSREFGDVSTGGIESYEYGGMLDRIGYDWKIFDLQNGTYTIDSPVYILRDSKGFYYKLRILDFYNQTGEKGYPKIETQKL